jgi:hypothetical protein
MRHRFTVQYPPDSVQLPPDLLERFRNSFLAINELETRNEADNKNESDGMFDPCSETS